MDFSNKQNYFIFIINYLNNKPHLVFLHALKVIIGQINKLILIKLQHGTDTLVANTQQSF